MLIGLIYLTVLHSLPLICICSFSPDIFSSMNILPSLKVCLDLSAEYLILSDVQRKVSSFYCCLWELVAGAELALCVTGSVA